MTIWWRRGCVAPLALVFAVMLVGSCWFTRRAWSQGARPSRTATAHLIEAATELMQQQQQQQPIRIACVGDSITDGFMASSTAMSYPAQLQGLLGAHYRVMGFGVGGTTAIKDQPFGRSYWTTKQFQESLASRPDIVVIMLGTNDACRDTWCTKMQDFVPDYNELINRYKRLPSLPRVLIAVPPPIYDGRKYRLIPRINNRLFFDLIPQIACDITIPIYDVFAQHCPLSRDLQVQPACEWISDGVHPNDEGYKAIAQAVADAIVHPIAASAPGTSCLTAALTTVQTRGRAVAHDDGFCRTPSTVFTRIPSSVSSVSSSYYATPFVAVDHGVSSTIFPAVAASGAAADSFLAGRAESS